MEAFGDETGGDLMHHPEKLIVPEGETFYAVMDRLRLFFVKFWQSDEEVCTIVSHGAITNVLSLMFLQAPLEKFWSMYMSACGVSKVQMKSIYSFTIEYWNANYFLKEGEKKYLKK
jgi:broad specificity phosphatase PhoE